MENPALYDQPEFFQNYSLLKRSLEGLEGAPEWPLLKSMLPPSVSGLRVVDLGCGFGWFCRWAQEQGASRILGIDLSEKMLSRARSSSNSAIEYQQANLERLSLPEAAFDLVYSSLALHYIENVESLFLTIFRSLSPGGHFVFSTEHPIFMAPTKPGWRIDEKDGKKTWPINRYSVEGARVTDWLTKGVVKFHRTIATTLNLLIRTGFSISRVEEFCPTKDQIAAQPGLAEECERPMFLLVSARR